MYNVLFTFSNVECITYQNPYKCMHGQSSLLSKQVYIYVVYTERWYLWFKSSLLNKQVYIYLVYTERWYLWFKSSLLSK